MIGSNTTFINSLHKTTGGSDWTFITVAESLDDTWANDAIGGTTKDAVDHGVRLFATATEGLQLAQYNGSAQATNNSSVSPRTTGSIFMAISYDHTAGEVTYWLCSATGETNSFAFGTTTSNATNLMNLGAVESTSFTFDVSQWRWKAASMWNKKLSDVEMADVIAEYETRHAADYTP